MPAAALTQHRVRHLETDSQGVVFNMWYLGYCDEACADHLESIGLAYPALRDQGFDFQVVHSSIDWTSSLRARDVADFSVTCDHVGTTSFSLRTEITSAGRPVAVARIVYVGVGPDGSPTPVPDSLRARLFPHPPERVPQL